MSSNPSDSADDDYDDDDISNDIAIIGMAGRFPMARDIDEFWENLVSSQDCITRFSREELIKMGVNEEALDDPNYVPAAGYIDDQDKFDANFFDFNPREAAQLDPQHRFALEVAWQAMENAGYVPEDAKNSVGVFAGSNMSTYLLFNLMKQGGNSSRDAIDTQISVDKDMVATRISYKLNLQGPSISLGTACSTSLVCIHLACQSILNGECKMALAGGSHIATPNTVGHVYREGGYSAPDSYCRAFDENGKGTVGGNGTCFILLKSLDDAIADNDHIYAVIKGSAVNNDGSEKIGYTAPSIEGQTNIVAEAQAIAGVSPDSIRFIEAHGTGTQLGDPIEFSALTRAFRIETEAKQFCAIGSLKTNIGHLGLAAGAAGIIKTALSLKHKLIPESLNYQKPNSKLDIENSPFYVADKLERIEASDEPVRAGISSLGIGGTNAHIILEEPPEIESSDSRKFQLFLLSAKTSSALNVMSDNLSRYMADSEESLGDIAYTLQKGRKRYAFSRAFVIPNAEGNANVKNSAELISADQGFTAKTGDKAKRIIFMFPGGGTQYVNMAKDLYRTEPSFKKSMDECAALFKEKSGLDPLSLLYDDQRSPDSREAYLPRPKQFFTVIFSVEYSLATLLMKWGIQPDGMVGHSLGEYVAACIAGIFSLDDVISLISFRGELFEKIGKGAMMSVSLPAPEVENILIPGVTIATINDPERCVLSGEIEPIEAFEKILKEKEIECRRLAIDTAGHSAMLDPLLPEFETFLKTLEFGQASIPIISNLSGEWADPEALRTPEYWKNHLRQTVRFSDGVKTLLADSGESIFVEVGPGNALSSFVRCQTDPKDGHVLVNAIRHIKEEKDDQSHLFETLGKLWINGVNIDWSAFYEDETRKRLPLPTYPYERKRYWIEPKKDSGNKREKLEVKDWFWQASWRLAEPSIARSLDAESDEQKVVIFADGLGLSNGVVTLLAAKNIVPITVVRGDYYRKISDVEYEINPTTSGDYQKLLKSLSERNALPNKILHCWNLDTQPDLAEHNNAHIHYHLPFVYLAKALGEFHNESALSIIAVTQKLENVTPGDVVDPNRSLIAGPAKVIPYEYPNITFRVVDLGLNDLPESQEVQKIPVAQVVSELFCTTLANETTVALRNNLRFVKDFHNVPLSSPESRPFHIKEAGVYIITGGVGGVGMVHAEALASSKVKLALMQRRSFPPEEQWDEILQAEDDLLLVDQINGIRNLQSSGAEVLVVKGDVCDSEKLSAALNSVREKWGGIDGLIHCAGYGEFVSIEETSESIITDVLAPKVLGTNLLLTALERDELDFVLLCSSMSSVTTGFGLVGYVSACAYLDAISHSQKSSATCYSTINWDLWKTSQQLAKNKIDLAAGKKPQELKTAIRANEGVDVLQRVLDASHSQIIVSTRDFRTLLKQNERFNQSLLLDGSDTFDESVDGEDDEGMELYERPSLSTPYVEPRNDKEKTLAKIWQDTLGISKIGIQDNFFELGGESLLGVKIVVKAKQEGLFIDPKKMFSTPTIQEIIEQLDDADVIESEQGIVSGSAPCTSVQESFFALDYHNVNHWNVSTLFTLSNALTEEVLESIAHRLADHHDVLRSEFLSDDSGESKWQQSFDKKDGLLSHYYYCSDSDSASFSATVVKQSSVLQASFDLGSGQVFQLAYFKGPVIGGASTEGRLLLIVHHLVMDAVSLSFVIEDLVTLLAGVFESSQESDQKEIHARISSIDLPSKTSSFKEYAEKLAKSAQSEQLSSDREYWSTRFSGEVSTSFSQDLGTGENRESDVAECSFSLSAATTKALSSLADSDQAVKINELLVIAMGSLLSKKTNNNRILIDIVGHGRSAFTEGLDVTRTAGWFGYGFPAVLSFADSTVSAQLTTLKQQLDSIPNDGVSFSMLKTLNGDSDIRREFEAYPTAQIAINYLGKQAPSRKSDSGEISSVIKPAGEKLLNIRDSENRRQYEHEIIAVVSEGQLQLNWKFSQKQYNEATIRELGDELLEILSTITEGQADDIDASVLSSIGLCSEHIESSYGLTALQTEMYKLWSDKTRALSNITQGVSVIDGHINVAQLRGLWQALIIRHPSLRTCFVENGLDAPRQIVVNPQTQPSCLDISIVEEDWSSKSEAEQKTLTQALLVQDRLTPFELDVAPAVRLYLVNLKADQSQSMIVQSNHQIILDGWSSSLLAQDLAYCATQLLQGKALEPLESDHSHQQYIQWLNTQDLSDIRSYWQGRLENYTPSKLLDSISSASEIVDAGTGVSSDDHYAELCFVVDTELVKAIGLASRASQTTPNAVFQGAWALTLNHLSGAKDLAYGVTVSGRSCDVDGIDLIIGQCTNSLPMRVQLNDETETVAQWLQALHKNNADLQHNNLISLDEIKELIGLESGAPLYQSNFVFENVPMAVDSPENTEAESNLTLSVKEGYWTDGWQFPLRVFVVPQGDDFWVKFAYDSLLFSDSVIADVAEQYQQYLQKLAADIKKKVSALI